MFLIILLRNFLFIYINDVVWIIFLFFDKKNRFWLFRIFLGDRFRFWKNNFIVFWVVFSLFGFSLLLFELSCCIIFVNVFGEIFLVVFKCLNSLKKLKRLFGIGIKYGVILYFFFNWRINFVYGNNCGKLDKNIKGIFWNVWIFIVIFLLFVYL